MFCLWSWTTCAGIDVPHPSLCVVPSVISTLACILVVPAACSDDFHLFPSTQLSQALPMAEKKNLTLDECKSLCCSIRTFRCRSISLHRETSDCALYAEDRNTAPPLGLSKVGVATWENTYSLISLSTSSCMLLIGLSLTYTALRIAILQKSCNSQNFPILPYTRASSLCFRKM